MIADAVTIESIEVRTFASLAEIWALDGFKHDNPIAQENYARLLGDYCFEDEVKCCFLKKNGKLCEKSHNSGYVALLKDGSITIVGNICARDKFGADSKIRADRSRYLNEKRRRERFAALKAAIATKEELLASLDSVLVGVKALQSRMAAFSQQLGTQTLKAIEGMSKTGNGNVTVIGVKYREYVDAEGETRQERQAAPSTLATLSGLSVFNPRLYKLVSSGVASVRAACATAASISDSASMSELDSIVSVIQDHRDVRDSAARLLDSEKVFLQNDLSAICFLASDRAERYKMAKLVLDLAGESAGKERAKEWLASKEAAIKAELRVDKLEIP